MGTGTANPAYVPPSVVNAARRDQRYFREISSPDVRRIYEAIDEVLDPMEYEGSLLFDEYPDVGEVSRLAEMALSWAAGRRNALAAGLSAGMEGTGVKAPNAVEENGSADAGTGNAGIRNGTAEKENQNEGNGYPALTREFARALLCEEMCRRRFRHLMRRAAGSNQKRE